MCKAREYYKLPDRHISLCFIGRRSRGPATEEDGPWTVFETDAGQNRDERAIQISGIGKQQYQIKIKSIKNRFTSKLTSSFRCLLFYYKQQQIF